MDDILTRRGARDRVEVDGGTRIGVARDLRESTRNADRVEERTTPPECHRQTLLDILHGRRAVRQHFSRVLRISAIFRTLV
jgi:hypothetical protein